MLKSILPYETMKNPFEKDDHKVFIAGIIIGSVAVGAAAYLFLTETGGTVRRELAGHFSRIRASFIGGGQETADDPKQYLQNPVKQPKTDREALMKHEIMGGKKDQQEEHQN